MRAKFPTVRRVATADVSDDQEAEYNRCARGLGGFMYWVRTYGRIEDARTKQIVRFELFAGQKRVAMDLVDGTWLVILKGRQLGVTWLCVAYVLWRVTFNRSFTAVIVNQKLEYAEDFIGKVTFMHDRLPWWLRKTVTTNKATRMGFFQGANKGDIRAMAPSARSGRSLTGDVVIIDEASRVPFLADTLQATMPVIEVAGGQVIQLSSSAGPSGPFYDCWAENYGDYGEVLGDDGVGPSGFKPLFLRWDERPGRDDAWYAREEARLSRINPVGMKQEHPNTVQEAWEYASGRIYAGFRREEHIGWITIPSHAKRYRAIDWGQSTSPMVCLWMAEVEGPPGLLISPDCPNTIRELFAYRWDEDRPDHPLKEDDHTPDAIRYAVVTFPLKGLVYVYREWYMPDSVAKGWDPMADIQRIHELTGWRRKEEEEGRGWQVKRDGELIDRSVADRAWGKMISLYNNNGIPLVGQKAPTRPQSRPKRSRRGTSLPPQDPADDPKTEVLEGIRLVSNLIAGSIPIDELIAVRRRVDVTPRRVAGQRVSVSLEERQKRHLARELVKAARRRHTRLTRPRG